MIDRLDIAAGLKQHIQNAPAFTGVSIHSGEVKPGHLFVAIEGPRFDGHEFVQEAVRHGALAVLSNRPIPSLNVVQFVVPDTVRALAEIASAHRRRLSCRVIALTGSNGKTTVKEMIATLLPKPAHATPGNLNNHIGVPLSVLQLRSEHRYAVFELGANHSGEIAQNVQIVQPHVALINNIAPAHVEGFGSIDGVALAKGEIYQGLLEHGVAVVNDDDAYAHFWDVGIQAHPVIRFSTTKAADVHARDMTFNAEGCARFSLVTPKGQGFLELKVPGVHNVANALAAAACAQALDIELSDILSGLSEFRGVSGRLAYCAGRNGACLIDDTYNANLRSVLASLEVLANHQGRRIFVFGDMGELGEWTQAHHEAVGQAARQLGIDQIMTCGVHSLSTAKSFGASARHYSDHDALVCDLLAELSPETTVLVKGSRAARMEVVVNQLKTVPS